METQDIRWLMLTVMLNGRRRLDTFSLNISGVTTRLQIIMAPHGKRGETSLVLAGEKNRQNIWSVSLAMEVPAHCMVDRAQTLVRYDGVEVEARIPCRRVDYNELPQFRETARDFSEYRKQLIGTYDNRHFAYWLLLYGQAAPAIAWCDFLVERTFVQAKLLMEDAR